MHAIKCLILALFFANKLFCSQVDLVVFSFDRPLQLYSFLESVEKYVTGCASISVVYRSSNEQYAQAYHQVEDRFAGVRFMAQGNNPREDFKPLTVKAIQEGTQEYILFGVDDIIVKDYVDLTVCTDLLKTTDAYGFYLSLGMHLNYCYPLQCNQAVPRCLRVRDDIHAWVFSKSEGDWNYPNTVDMTVYRKAEVLPLFVSMNYHSPNACESVWAGLAYAVINKAGLFFEYSKVVNLPLNRVQNDFHNVNMNLLTAQEMLELFNQGLKINIDSLYRIENKSRHMEYVPTYIQR